MTQFLRSGSLNLTVRIIRSWPRRSLHAASENRPAQHSGRWILLPPAVAEFFNVAYPAIFPTTDSESYVIIVYAGSQVDEPDREVPRLPGRAEAELMVRLRGLVQSLKPSLVIGALAAGADILFARAALAEGIPVQAVLPFGRDDFRRTSVESRGEPWTSHYDRILGNSKVKVIEDSQKVEDSAETFMAHNLTILDSASSIAEATGERVWVITIRPTPTSDSPSVTDDIVSRAEDRGYLTIDLSPSPPKDQRICCHALWSQT